MGTGLEIVIVGALIAGTAATTVSVIAAQKANKARKRQASLVNARSKRAQVREARIRRAQLLNVGAQGAATSAVAGGVAGVESQLGANLSFLDQTFALQRKALSADAISNIAGGVSSIAGQVAAFAGQREAAARKPTPVEGIT